MALEHTQRRQIAGRLARIAGHVSAIQKMVESDRSCTDILQQMAAVMKAMEGARKTLLEDHLESCIISAVEEGHGRVAVEELRRTLKLVLR